jgi:hypothetical protein
VYLSRAARDLNLLPSPSRIAPSLPPEPRVHSPRHGLRRFRDQRKRESRGFIRCSPGLVVCGLTSVGTSVCQPQANLRREGNADGGAGAKKIPKCTGWDEELLAAGNGCGLRASRVETDGGYIRQVVYGRG